MEWTFIEAILTKFGFGPHFFGFIRATQVLALSVVLIHGQLPSKFYIQISVKQVCRLSTPSFVTVKSGTRNIKGIELLDLGIHNSMP